MKKLSFSLLGSLVVVLIVASFIEKLYGSDIAGRYVYTAPYTIALWVAAVISALVYIVKVRAYRQLATFVLHLSFAVILLGAMITHIWGEQGTLHLRQGHVENSFRVGDADAALPFEVSLVDFQTEYYPGTRAPMDFLSRIRIDDHGVSDTAVVSMNHIATHRHYRFYQSGFDSDMLGATLSVSHDPAGIAVTYCGYAMLLLSMLTFFFQKRTHFRSIWRKTFVMTALLTLFAAPGMAQTDTTYRHPGLIASGQDVEPSGGTNAPKALQRGLAKSFGNLYVYYNDRVCPLSTLARDFTLKLYGKTHYKGLTPEQVLTGWLFYYDEWKREPMVQIKGDEVRRKLGVQGKYASLEDFVAGGKYKLEDLLSANDKNARAADEKFNLISMVSMGTLFKIYPCSTQAQPRLTWYSWVDRLPADVDYEQWNVIKNSMNEVAYDILQGHNVAADKMLRNLRRYQRQHAGAANLPTDQRFRAEQFYYRHEFTKPLAMLCATLGLLLFLLYVVLLSRGIERPMWLRICSAVVLAAVFVVLTVYLSLRAYISGHAPMSNGHETMQFLAWCTALAGLVMERRVYMALPSSILVCGMTLMVSMMSAANPQITNLMPVLQSPLLSVHVAVIMLSYSLLALIMLNGVAAVAMRLSGGDADGEKSAKLADISRLMLYPAVFCLAAGIFVGAVWANISWGRYWGWDPKEVWALITMLVYAFPLHSNSLSIFRKPMFFHVYVMLAFLSVLFTYFGVNFLLGGMHSYA